MCKARTVCGIAVFALVVYEVIKAVFRIITLGLSKLIR
jgi:hypothetical protein